MCLPLNKSKPSQEKRIGKACCASKGCNQIAAEHIRPKRTNVIDTTQQFKTTEPCASCFENEVVLVSLVSYCTWCLVWSGVLRSVYGRTVDFQD